MAESPITPSSRCFFSFWGYHRVYKPLLTHNEQLDFSLGGTFDWTLVVELGSQDSTAVSLPDSD